MTRADVIAGVKAALEAAFDWFERHEDATLTEQAHQMLEALDPAAIAAGVAVPPVPKLVADRDFQWLQQAMKHPSSALDRYRMLAGDDIDRLEYENKDLRARVAELENMIRDLCMGHPDTCQCRHCKAVFVQEHSGENAT